MTASRLEDLPGFGPFRIDTAGRMLFRDGKQVPLRPQAFSALEVLFNHRNELVTYEKLEEFAWKSRHVSRQTLRVTVDEVKAELGEESSHRIETRQKLGFCLHVEADKKQSTNNLAAANRLRTIALHRTKTHTGRALQASIRQYEDALKNGTNLNASVELAKAYINVSHTGFCLDLPQRTMPRVRDLLADVLKHNPEFATAYAVRGLAALIYDYDWQRATDDLHKALNLDSDNVYAHGFLGRLEVARRDFKSGLQHVRHAAQLDYTTPMTAFLVPWMLHFAGREEEALVEASRSIDDYEPFAVGKIIYGYTLEAVGFSERAIIEYKQSLGIEFFPDAQARLGHAYGRLGKRQNAFSCLKKLRKAVSEGVIAYLPAYYEALICVGLGENDRALDCLEKAFVQKCDWLIYLNVEPSWKDLRKSSRFIELCQRVGLKPVTSHDD